MADGSHHETTAARSVPNNVEAEQALLGAVMYNNKAFHNVAAYLQPHHFYSEVNGLVWMVIQNLMRESRQANAITMKPQLEGFGLFEDAGGMKYLAGLGGAMVTMVNTSDYGRLIYDTWARREIITAAVKLIEEARRPDIEDTPQTLVERHEAEMLKILGSGATDGGLKPMSEVLPNALAEWEHQDKGAKGVPTGFEDVDKFLGGLHPTDMIVLAGRPSMGKDQPLDAKVLMANGSFRRMGDIKIGDRLASIDGKPSRVTGVFPQGRKQVYRITFSDGRSTEAGLEHLWRIMYRDWEAPRVVTTEKLIEMLSRTRYKHRLWIDTVTGDFGDKDPLPLDPWCVGALLANGGFTSGGTPKFSTADAATLKQLKRRLGPGFRFAQDDPYTWRIGKSGSRSNGLNPLTVALDSLAIYGLTSDHKFMPAIYKTVSKAQRIELLQGLLDTDGWVEKCGAVCYSSSSKQLAEDVQYLVRSLGGVCGISYKPRPKYSYKGRQMIGQPHWTCSISHPDKGKWLTLKRKRARVSHQRTQRLTVTSIKPTRLTQTQCLAVSHPSHLYVTDDFIVTHNTALATNIAFNAARFFRETQDLEHRGKQVAFFSLEMAAEQLGSRLITGETGIVSPRNRWGKPFQDHEWITAQEMVNSYLNLPFWVDDDPGVTLAGIKSRAIRLHRKKKVGLIIIDYLQLIAGEKGGDQKRIEQISHITRGIKRMAKELKVPVLALSQLSRAIENREEKRPLLSDLRESGTIENDADIVAFTHRPEYYLKAQGEPARKASETTDAYHDRLALYYQAVEASENKCELIIGKQRHGPLGSVDLFFDKAATTFHQRNPKLGNDGGTEERGERLPF